jgi:putative transposase
MTGPNPTDRGKIGTKRHVLTDQRGIPVSVIITSANTHDMKAATDTLDNVIVERPPLKKQNLCLDKGYDYPEIERESIKKEDTCRIFVTEV